MAKNDEKSGTDRADLIAEIQSLIDDLGYVPSYHDIEMKGKRDVQEYTAEFGSWAKAVKAAGFEKRDTLKKDDKMANDIQSVAEELGRPPTLEEYADKGNFSQKQMRITFDSWDAAIRATDVVTPAPDELIADIERLKSKLGRVPSVSHVNSHSDFSVRDFTHQFGSVPQAVEAAGLSYDEAICEAIADVERGMIEVPTIADFEAQTPYSSAAVNHVFDGWEAALESAEIGTEADTTPTRQTKRNTDGAVDGGSTESGDEAPEPNPLAEYYESLRMLRLTQETLFGGEPSASLDPGTPMERWYSLVRKWVIEDGPEEEGDAYGQQQRERNHVDMPAYRESYGDGDIVLDFQTVETASVPASIQQLVAENSPEEIQIAKYSIPIAPDSGEQLPVVVETTSELNRARELLNELPVEPQTSTTGSPQTPPSTPTAPPDGGSDSGDGEDKLTEIGGVTAELANKLRGHGYESHSAIAKADIQELVDELGISQVKAARIVTAAGD